VLAIKFPNTILSYYILLGCIEAFCSENKGFAVDFKGKSTGLENR